MVVVAVVCVVYDCPAPRWLSASWHWLQMSQLNSTQLRILKHTGEIVNEAVTRCLGVFLGVGPRSAWAGWWSMLPSCHERRPRTHPWPLFNNSDAWREPADDGWMAEGVQRRVLGTRWTGRTRSRVLRPYPAGRAVSSRLSVRCWRGEFSADRSAVCRTDVDDRSTEVCGAWCCQQVSLGRHQGMHLAPVRLLLLACIIVNPVNRYADGSISIHQMIHVSCKL